MKTTLGILSLAALTITNACGQSTEASVSTTHQNRQPDMLQLDPGLMEQQIEAMFHLQAEAVSRVFGVDVAVDGVVPRLLRMEQPLQLINPFAPPEYGIGAEILSINNPASTKPARKVEGISFFTIRF